MSFKTKIPKTFDLAGQEVDVRANKESNDDSDGKTRYYENVIEYSTHRKGKPLKKDKIMSTFYHELAHMLLDVMGEDELSENEKFVNTLGHFFWQYIKSSKFK